MARTIPKAPALIARTSSERVEETRTYAFLTPVFGGGVEPQKPDPITPVRGASIRGQLRFWWRAANPRGLRDEDELRKAEAEIFGSPKKRSQLIIHVDTTELRAGRPVTPVDSIAYGAFPLNNNNTLYEYRGTFALGIACPAKCKHDVEAALWAWSTFGGLGGRARRGFGAIRTVSPSETGVDEGWSKFVTATDVQWPHLVRYRLGKTNHESGLDAQICLLRSLRDLRQGAGLGRRYREQGPGRSYWPEPDTLREILRQRANNHAKNVTHVTAFPRAAFGLPIVFHFQHPHDPVNGTAKSVTGADGRFASPLVFRPINVGNEIRSIAAALKPRPTRVTVGNKTVRVAVDADEVATGIPRPRNATDDDYPMMFIDPIEAFFRRIQ